MLLDATTRRITVKSDATAATTEPSLVADYVDLGTESGDYIPAANQTLLTGATRVEAVAAPDAGYQREVRELAIFNGDTAARVITVEYDDNGTYRVLYETTLAPRKTLLYRKETGWTVPNSAGAGFEAATISGQTEDTAPDPAADYLVALSDAAGDLRKTALGRVSNFAKSKAVAGSATPGSGDFFRTLLVDASGGAATITLPGSAVADDWIVVRKVDSSGNRVTVKDISANDIAWLSAQHDEVCFARWGGAWVAVFWSIAPLLDAYTSAGSTAWTKPPLARRLLVLCIGGGGGGGSGRRGAAGSARGGGGGGAGGAVVRADLPAASAAATETVTVGGGGNGNAGKTTDNTNGGGGSDGAASSFGALVAAAGGPGGNGGSSSGGLGATALTGLLTNYGLSGGGGNSSVTATANSGGSGQAGGGGGGGGISTADAMLSPGSGGAGSLLRGISLSGGGADTNGIDVPEALTYIGGSGAGGGSPSISAAANPGKTGGAPGGGGGGGGASLNGFTSGAGGKGGDGAVRILTIF